MGDAGSGGRGRRAVGTGDIMSLFFVRRLAWITCIFMFVIGVIAVMGDLAFGGTNGSGPIAAVGFFILGALAALLWAAWGLARGRRGTWTTTVVVLGGWAVFVTSALTVPSMRGFTFINWALTLPAIGLLLRRGTRQAYRQGTARD
ncbi:MAG: hypothetical protein ACRDKW_03585, partial [Actinomycetota bacterium]